MAGDGVTQVPRVPTWHAMMCIPILLSAQKHSDNENDDVSTQLASGFAQVLHTSLCGSFPL